MTKNSKHKLYWPPAVTVDVVIFTIEDNDLKVLLLMRPQEPFRGYLALPGGFLLKNEKTQKAAERILREKAGISKIYLEQLYTFDGPRRDPRGHVLTVSYMALAPRLEIGFETKNIVQLPLFASVKKLSRLAFDHEDIISYAWKRLQAKLEYTNVIFSLLPPSFTFNELQRTYEIILGKKLDKRNFRKKFLELGLIKPTRKFQRGTRQRPARLYTFVSRKPTELKKFF